ncbi:MAG: hypothetical protein DRH26_01395 [Deltaproteobacteria bacterium]|nr:MAG: hypothetical protein DRH26_01395 [Deltaproteobacteria bacterium]
MKIKNQRAKDNHLSESLKLEKMEGTPFAKKIERYYEPEIKLPTEFYLWFGRQFGIMKYDVSEKSEKGRTLEEKKTSLFQQAVRDIMALTYCDWETARKYVKLNIDGKFKREKSEWLKNQEAEKEQFGGN